MFILFAARALCFKPIPCTTITEIGISMNVYDIDVIKGEMLCIRSKEPNFGVIFTQIDDTIVSVGESERYNSKPRNVRVYTDKTGVYVRNYAYINFTARKNTHWHLTTVTFPEECRDSVWMSNAPGTRFVMSDGETGEHQMRIGSTCAVFGPGSTQSYALDVTLNEGVDSFEILDDEKRKTLKNGRSEIDLMHSLFHVDVRSRGSRRLVEVRTERNADLTVTQPFSGFMAHYGDEEVPRRNGLIISLIVFAVAGIVFAAFYFRRGQLPFASFFTPTKGFANLSTLPGPRTLI